MDNEIPKLRNKIKSVQLCFTTDPFMENYPEVREMSLKAIKKLNDADIQCNILTKGRLPLALQQYSKKNEYGITLVSLNEKYRKEYEPNSVSYKARILALKKLHDAG